MSIISSILVTFEKNEERIVIYSKSRLGKWLPPASASPELKAMLMGSFGSR